MKERIYTNFEELPLFLNAETLAKVLGISVSSSYELIHDKDFSAIRIGSKIGCYKRKITALDRRKDGKVKIIFEEEIFQT